LSSIRGTGDAIDLAGDPLQIAVHLGGRLDHAAYLHVGKLLDDGFKTLPEALASQVLAHDPPFGVLTHGERGLGSSSRR
jgi:hypothetical protein